MEDELTFRALVDPNRRLLLDRLFERDGQTLGELAAGIPQMSRQGVMKHLRLLEEAGLVVTRRQGRSKLHFLNPVPIQRIHSRWISRYTAPLAAALGRLKDVMEAPMDPTRSHVYQVYIATTPERLWAAITDPAETQRYYYGTAVHSDWHEGSPLEYTYPDGSVAANGKVLEVETNRRVVMEFNPVWDDEIRDEPPVRMTWEIDPSGALCKLTVTTDGVVPGSATESQFEGGIQYIVSGLKTLLETGAPMPAGAAQG
ncbi:MAG: hypothetical protein QOH61_620 [Chloroflexota bacterium]|nr:hypothetical protein [Chloroflexota bacterium]